MEFDKDKVDEEALAVLYLTTFDDGYGLRAWKGMEWGAKDLACTKRGPLVIPRARQSR